MTEKNDAVNHPSHYTCYEHEVIELTEKLDFCLGNAVKYILRADHKGSKAKDLRKAAWYVERLLLRGEYWFEGLLPGSEDDESYEIEKLVDSFHNPILTKLMDAIACDDDVAVNSVICWLRSEADDCEAEEAYKERIRELEEENARLLRELSTQRHLPSAVESTMERVAYSKFGDIFPEPYVPMAVCRLEVL